MKTFFVWGLISLVSLPLAAVNFDQDANVKTIRKNHARSLSGVADDTGFWIMSVGFGQSKAKADEAARAEMAKVLSVKVSAAAQSYYSENNADVRESFSRWSRTDTQELLSGLRIIKSYQEGNSIYSIALVTQRIADATLELREAMQRLPEGTVKASGEGATQKEALDAACRSALEQVNGVRILATSASMDNEAVRSHIYADVQGFVSNYRILAEEEKEGRWYVTIVAKVEKEELQEDYRTQLSFVGDPTFWVEGENIDAVTAVSDYLHDKGFKTTEQKDITADYKVTVTTNFRKVKNPVGKSEGLQLQLTLKCFDKGGNRFFSLSNNPRKANSFIGDDLRQSQICVSKAMKQIDDELHARLEKAVSRLVNDGRPMRIVFRNVTTLEQLAFIEEIVTQINNMPGAKSAVSFMDEDVMVAIIRFNLKGGSQEFLDMLRAHVPDLMPALSVSVNKLIFEF